MTFLFENLSIYRKSIEFAHAAARLTQAFPEPAGYLGDQLNRTALAIAAHLAEGNGRWHRNDRRQFFLVARGAIHACVPMLELGHLQGLITVEQHEALRAQLETLCRMIAGLIKTTEERDSLPEKTTAL